VVLDGLNDDKLMHDGDSNLGLLLLGWLVATAAGDFTTDGEVNGYSSTCRASGHSSND